MFTNLTVLDNVSNIICAPSKALSIISHCHVTREQRRRLLNYVLTGSSTCSSFSLKFIDCKYRARAK
jgi:hypothetical protein